MSFYTPFNFLCLFSLLIRLSAASELPRTLPPGDPKIALQGAWTDDFRGAWTGIGFKVRTDAKEMNLLFKDFAPGGEHPRVEGGYRNNYLNLRIDDNEPVVIALQKGQTRYAVPGLDGKPRTVTVFRRTEPLFKPIQFLGLELPANAHLMDPPPASSLRLQVIGDSISSGYANETDGPKSSFTQPTENGGMTYWAIAARELGADIRCAAWSGKGVLRDRKNNSDGQLPGIWRYALPEQEVPERDGVTWMPTHVVINLGTNDIARGIPDEADFKQAYQALIEDIRSTAPTAKIFLCFGPLINQKKHGQILEFLNQLAIKNQETYVLQLSNPFGIKGAGAHWHPNVKANIKMAEQLLAAIRRKN
jgi:lysophospholipase L1-like esterase